MNMKYGQWQQEKPFFWKPDICIIQMEDGQVYAGRNMMGIPVHCSSGKNGVTVGEAYSASFRYIRQPSFYPTQEQVQEMQSSSTVSITTGDAAASTGTDIFSANVTVSNTLQDAMKSNTSDSTGFTTSGSTEKTSILPDKIDLSKEKVAVFKAK